MRGTLLRLSASKPPPPSSSSFLSRYTAAKRNESDQSKAIESAMSALPPTVNRPDQRAIHFPKALDPDRAFIYSKKIEKTRKPTSMGFRIFNICLYALCAGVAYWSMFVRDWDDRVLGGKVSSTPISSSLSLFPASLPDSDFRSSFFLSSDSPRIVATRSSQTLSSPSRSHR
ncbi:hypothetical protein BDY24DRAFT_276435 [Mrakia frigida]|uniref:uncharacterized protein n=1 Tax=Mrakia frigida TaxID=29902 RepID=UPI003FCC0648